MITWEELIEKAQEYLEENYPNRHISYQAKDFLFDIMQDGQEGETVDGVHESHFFVPDKFFKFAYVLHEYWIPAQDDEDEAKVIGYALS